MTLDLAKAFVATDFDGDSVQLDSGASVAIENDVPANNATTLADEAGVRGRSAGSTGIGGGDDDGGVHDGGACDAGDSARTSR